MIAVLADVSSDEPLTSATVRLLNGFKHSVTSSVVIQIPGERSYRINTPFIIDNENLESGEYYIEVSASNGQTNGRAHVAIVVNAIPRTLQKVYIAGESSGTVNIHVLDSAGLTPSVLSLPGPFTDAGISPADKQFYVLTKPVTFISTLNDSVSHVLQPESALPQHAFTSLDVYDNLVFVSVHVGEIKAFDASGHLQFETVYSPYIETGRTLLRGDHLLTSVYYPASSQRRIAVFFYPGGAPRQECIIDFDVVSMFALSDDEFILFGMRNGEIIAAGYTMGGNNAFFLKSFGMGTLTDAAMVDEENFLLCTGHGLVHYRKNISSQFAVTTYPVYTLEINELNDEIYCASGNTLRVLLPGSFSEIFQQQLPDSIVSIKAVYSK